MSSLACVPTLDQRGAYDDPLSSLFAIILVSFSYYGRTMLSKLKVWMCVYHASQLISNDYNIGIKF